MKLSALEKIFVYARPWNKDQFLDLATRIAPEAKVHVISEHRGIDECHLANRFYDYFYSSNSAIVDDINESTIEDVICRCRLLRNIDSEKARRMVAAMSRAISEALIQTRPDIVISITVDSYVIHLLYLHCKASQIPFLGLIPSFVKEYFRVTSLGERNRSRVVTSDEVEQVKQMLLDREYKPKFVSKRRNAAKAKAIKNWAKNIIKPIWFYALRQITGDRLNYHYYATQLVSSRYWTLFPQIYTGIRPISRSDLIDASDPRKLIFLPLQMSPEATIDYWSVDRSWIDYENKIINFINEHEDFAIFAVKEHPNVLGNRTRGFYGRVRRLSNCKLIDAEFNSNELINLCDGVVVCTGSVGFEAAIRFKTVYSDAQPYYLPSASFNPTLGIKNKEMQDSTVCELAGIDDTIKFLLEGLIPGDFINDGSWSKSNFEHLEKNHQVARGIINYINFRSGVNG